MKNDPRESSDPLMVSFTGCPNKFWMENFVGSPCSNLANMFLNQNLMRQNFGHFDSIFLHVCNLTSFSIQFDRVTRYPPYVIQKSQQRLKLIKKSLVSHKNMRHYCYLDNNLKVKAIAFTSYFRVLGVNALRAAKR